ncbi:MAG: hypothetical protein ACRDRO_04210 [Pseudonocardiaceae bacterium]
MPTPELRPLVLPRPLAVIVLFLGITVLVLGITGTTDVVGPVIQWLGSVWDAVYNEIAALPGQIAGLLS